MVLTGGGNVGIGTTGAVTKLALGGYSGARLAYVNGTSNTFDTNGITVSSSNSANAAIGGGIDLTNNTYSVGAYSPIISFSSLSLSTSYNNAYAGIWGVFAGPGGDSNWNVGHLVFGTASAYGISERMRITSGGNVGIGISPSFKLDVNRGSSGVVLNLEGENAYNAETGILMSSGRAKISGFLNGSGGTPGTNLRFYTMPDGGSVTERLRIDSNGNVGIGNSGEAASRLFVTGVNSTSSNFALTLRNSNGNELMQVRNDGYTAIIGVANIYQGGTNRVVELSGNSNAQGNANYYTIVRHYPVVSAGTKLIIPFVSQGNLNSTTLIYITGHSARYNSRLPRGFSAYIEVGHLTVLSDLNSWGVGGNISSIGYGSGMNIEINFAGAYTSAEANGVYVTISYMTNIPAYSIDVPNIAMN